MLTCSYCNDNAATCKISHPTGGVAFCNSFSLHPMKNIPKFVSTRFYHIVLQAVSVYRLDCTDLADWQRLSDQAVDLAQVVLGRKPRSERTLKPMDIEQKNALPPVYGDYYCNGCSRLFSSKWCCRRRLLRRGLKKKKTNINYCRAII